MSDTSIRTGRYESIPSALPVQAVGSRGHQADARRSEGMAEAEASAVDVQLLHRNLAKLRMQKSRKAGREGGREG